jgi:hypothetical protein
MPPGTQRTVTVPLTSAERHWLARHRHVLVTIVTQAKSQTFDEPYEEQTIAVRPHY